ncbi:MAG: N-formylglutamate amidohydrolase [Sphingomicrobium sp.]
MLLSVPHAGRDYPEWLLEMAAKGKASLTSLEDPLVDRLVWRSLQRGVGAVIATAPRAAVDCNRAEHEVDPAVVEGSSGRPLSPRARGGLGIVPGRTQKHGFLWQKAIRADQLEQRLDAAHRPYHNAVEQELRRLHERFGCALLLDCHSMPPPAPGIPTIVFGDRHGESAAGWIGEKARQIAGRLGFRAGSNDPFAGGHIVERHGNPGREVHALQIEIDRSAYLDPTLSRPGVGFDRLAVLIETLALELGNALAERGYATAAE